MKKIFIMIILCLTLSACSLKSNENNNSNKTEEVTKNEGNIKIPTEELGNIDHVEEIDTSNMFEETDNLVDSENFVSIKNDVDAKYLYLKIEGSYLFEGNYDKSVVITADKKIVHLKLKNVKFELDNFSAIYASSVEKVIITLEGNNEIIVNNSIVPFDKNNVDSAIFVKGNLTINGSGSLSINSQNNGICSKDNLKIIDANIDIKAQNHGIDANDSIRIKNANISIDVKYDGLHCANIDDHTLGFIYIHSGNIDINCGSDGISASNYLNIHNGNINVKNGKTYSLGNEYSKKGLKAVSDLIISNGNIVIDTLDDAIHSNKSVEISGGKMELSSGDDGIHADSSIIILGGEISIKKSYEGIESQNISINGSVINLIASDDGINCAGGVDQEVGGRPGDDHFATDSEAFIIVNSGDLYINANGDGIDSNGTITVNGGNIVVEGPTSNGNSALDYGISATINGGTFIAIGSSGMSSNFSNATQGVIMYNTNNNAIGTVIKLFDSNGKVLHEFKTTKAFSSVIISTKDMSKGNTYRLEIGSSSNEITLSSLIYSNSKGMGGPGGPKPPR